MSKTTDSLVRIVSAGGGLIIDCKGKTTDSLVRIASASKQKGSKVIMTNLKGKTTEKVEVFFQKKNKKGYTFKKRDCYDKI